MQTLVDRGPPLPLGHVYLHVPFCTDRCTYCAFATVPEDPRQHAPLVDALLAEWAGRRESPASLRTVYLGGGTPGLLAPELLERLLGSLAAEAPGLDRAEITLEVNPANVSRQRLEAWAALGITRLSVGIQTFDDRALAELARRHDGRTARQALDLLAEHWPGTWSADLLVGWRDQGLAQLDGDLDTLLARRPPHVSVYGLTIEPRTALASQAAHGARVLADPDDDALRDERWVARLQAAGLARYEVSNFARPGHESRHNQAYWENLEYLGLGPGAASSIGHLRWSNLTSTREYLRRAPRHRPLRERVERLTPSQRLLETLATGLRTAKGVSKHLLGDRFGRCWSHHLESHLSEILSKGSLVDSNDSLFIAADHRSRTDAILSDLTRAADL